MKYNYRIIRTNRKRIAIEVNSEGLVVRAPLKVSNQDIERFIQNNKSWIDKHMLKLEKSKNTALAEGKLEFEELQALAKEALKVIPERVRYYAPLIGVTYGRITIRNQKTRWGSCSEKGNLNFNCLLMLTPPEVIDSVVVHELCHRKEMNHSKKFYDEVLKVFPDYHKWNRWLKENGPALMMRVNGNNL